MNPTLNRKRIALVIAGAVTETEVDDLECKYEVEVTLDDGSRVDVQLEDFQVVGTEDEGTGDESGADDD